MLELVEASKAIAINRKVYAKIFDIDVEVYDIFAESDLGGYNFKCREINSLFDYHIKRNCYDSSQLTITKTSLQSQVDYAQNDETQFDYVKNRLAWQEYDTITLNETNKSIDAPFTEADLIGLQVVDKCEGRRLLTTPTNRPSDDLINQTLYAAGSNGELNVGYTDYDGMLNHPVLYAMGGQLVAHCPTFIKYYSSYNAIVYAFEDTSDNTGAVSLQKGWYVVNTTTFAYEPFDIELNPVIFYKTSFVNNGDKSFDSGIQNNSGDYLNSELMPFVEEYIYTVTEENILSRNEDGVESLLISYFKIHDWDYDYSYDTANDVLWMAEILFVGHLPSFYYFIEDNKLSFNYGSVINSSDEVTITYPSTIHKIDPKYLPIDAELLETSENPVQNKVIYEVLNEKVSYTAQTLSDEQQAQARANIGAGTSDFSGSYNDLADKPTLFSGSYNDLTDTPVIPSIDGLVADLGNKVDKVDGKSLSTNDYTDADKAKLDGIEAEANKTIIDPTLTVSGQAADAKAVSDAINAPKDYVILRDQVNSYNYIVEMRSGNLISRCKTASIRVSQLPDKMEYVEGDTFDPTGMIVEAVGEDGSAKVIENYVTSDDALVPDVELQITYTEYGQTFETSVAPNVALVENALADFEYTANDDGTYELTAWKGTLNGESSTEIVVPNSPLIIV